MSNIWQHQGTQVGLGVVVAVLMIGAIESSSTYDEECGWGWPRTTNRSWDNRHELIREHGRCHFELRLEGEVVPAADSRGFVRVGNDGLLEIEDRGRGTDRWLRVTAVDNEPSYAYKVEGQEAAFDDAGRDWLAESLPQIQRLTGVGAAERVAVLLEDGGIAAVVEEIGEIRRDRIQALYLRELLRHLEEPQEVAEALDETVWEIGSDQELSRALAEVPTEFLLNDSVMAAISKGAQRIGSNEQLRRLAVAHLKEAPPEALPEILDLAADEITSDYEMASLLKEFLELHPQTPLPDAFFDAVDTMGSDSPTQQTLSAAVSADRTDQEVERLLTAGLTISSDNEQMRLLLAVVESFPSEARLPDAFFRALSTIESDSLQRRVAEATMVWPGFERETATRLLDALLGLGSDHEMATVLETLIRALPDAASLPGFERSLATVSEYHQEQIQEMTGRINAK